MTFAEIIRFHRERLGLNKKQLAEKVSVTQPYIVQIENDGKIPGDGVVLRLADSLGLDRRELLFAAYRARASEDTRHYFSSIFDDLSPSEEFSQPFIEARKDQFESPDFSLRHLSTASDHAFQVAVLKAKAEDARFSAHAHSVHQVFIAIDGKFEITIDDKTQILDGKSQIALTIPPESHHKIRCLEIGRLLTVTLGQVVRVGGSRSVKS